MSFEDQSSVIKRKIILDVERQRSSRKNKRRKHRRHDHNVVMQEDDACHDTRPVPLELRPVIDAMINYGRKTNALGSLATTSSLDTFVNELRTIINGYTKIVRYNDDQYVATDRALSLLVQRMENESRSIKSTFEKTYDVEEINR